MLIAWHVDYLTIIFLNVEKIIPKSTYLLTENKSTSIEDLGLFINGVEPNRILQYVMSVPLRNTETQEIGRASCRERV